MPLHSDDYDGARRVLAGLLEELGVADYTFAIEPAADGWRVHVECVAHGGWQESTLRLPHTAFAAAAEDGDARRSVLAILDARLAECRRTP
mgnify:CR=1 FL=1